MNTHIVRSHLEPCFALTFAAAVWGAAAPAGWLQVNQDGFAGYDGTTDGTSLFVFGGELYAHNEDGLFVMQDPAAGAWAQLVPPAPPAGPGAAARFVVLGDYLYAFDSGQLWWLMEGASVTGNGWQPVSSIGLPGNVSPSPRVIFKNRLYGVHYTGGSAGSPPAVFEIWRTSDLGKPTATWELVVGNSFNDPVNNAGVDVMIVFNDRLCAGTTTLHGVFGDPTSYGTGVEIWESVSGDSGTWSQVNADGFGTTFPGCVGSVCNFAIHQVIGSAAVYQPAGSSQPYLVVGTKSHYGAETWRYDGNGLSGWANVTPPWAGPCLLGCGPGRNEDMTVFQGKLFLAEGFPTANLAAFDGTDWEVVVPGPYPFDADNQGLASLALRNNRIYVSTLHKPYAGVTQGDQVWGFPFTAPVAVCQDVTVSADETCLANAAIDAGSYDPDGDPIALTQSPPGPYPLGATPVTLTVTDSVGLSATCVGTVTVMDTSPPIVDSVTAEPSLLWPANHTMVPVTVSVVASDNCTSGQDLSCRIIAVESSEPDNGLGDGDSRQDVLIVGDLMVKLRAERAGLGNGRTYTIKVQCADLAGNETSETVKVVVPHAMRVQ